MNSGAVEYLSETFQATTVADITVFTQTKFLAASGKGKVVGIGFNCVNSDIQFTLFAGGQQVIKDATTLAFVPTATQKIFKTDVVENTQFTITTNSATSANPVFVTLFYKIPEL